MENDRLSENENTEPTPEELAEWRASKNQANNVPTRVDPSAVVFGDSDFVAHPGQVVSLGDGTLGIVVAIGNATLTDGTVVPGYRVAALGQANDSPVDAETLGLTVL